MPDQPRGHRVEDAAQDESAVAGDEDQFLLVIIGAARWQRLEPGSLDLQCPAAACIGVTDHLIDKPAVVGEVGKVAAPAQQQSLLQRSLEMGMWSLDRAVLVCQATIVARWRHAIVRTQRLVALSQILRRIGLEIAERRRETVAAVFLRCATERPQGVLQTLGQGDEALAAQYHASLLPTGERQAEVIEPMIERDTSDAHAQLHRIGEIRQRLLTRRMLLTEDPLPLRSMQRLPVADPPLQRATQIVRKARMPTLHLLQQGDRT